MSGVITVPFHIGDFLSGTLHMDTLEKGAYIMLLLAHYQTGAAGLPNDDTKLARIAGVSPTVWRRIKSVVLEKFDAAGENIISKKVQKVISGIEEKSSAQRAKALKRHEPDHATAEPRHSQPKPKPKPIVVVDDPQVKSEVMQTGEMIAKITGWDANPNWLGNYSLVEVWLANGWDAERDILPTVRQLMAKKTGPPPSSLKYFERAIANAYATRTQPIAQGKPNGKPDKRTKLANEANELLERIRASELSENPNGFN